MFKVFKAHLCDVQVYLRVLHRSKITRSHLIQVLCSNGRGKQRGRILHSYEQITVDTELSSKTYGASQRIWGFLLIQTTIVKLHNAFKSSLWDYYGCLNCKMSVGAQTHTPTQTKHKATVLILSRHGSHRLLLEHKWHHMTQESQRASWFIQFLCISARLCPSPKAMLAKASAIWSRCHQAVN